ncbi:hypothetical protein D3C78_755380 [compost metagenome]
MLAGNIEGVTTQREGARGVADTLDVETGDLLLEAAGAEQDVFLGNTAVSEIQLAPVLAAHEGGGLADFETGGTALDDHRTDTVYSRSETDVDQEGVGVRAVGGEDLGAVDDEVVAVFNRGSLQLGHGGTGAWLTHTEGQEAFTGDQIGQKALFQLRRSIFGEGADGAKVACLHHIGTLRADQSKFLNSDYCIHQGPADAAVLFFDRNAQHALRGKFGRDVPRVVMGVRALQRTTGQLALSETTDGIGEGLLFFCEMEIHD